ncbi:MAG: Cna B-type domain-containing protein [Erysipelotrichaceae bacterium]|nr:Cna B-type domain-containing protein [Erysipelotrichaceae bacterium]
MRRIGKVLLTMAFVLSMLVSNSLGISPLATRVKAEVIPPEHDKTATPNKTEDGSNDGTYKIELSVTGDADTEVETASNVNVLIVYDVSSSMTSNNVTTNPNRNRADYAEDIVHDFIENLRGYQSSSNPNNIQVAIVTFAVTGAQRQGWTSNLTSNNNGANRFFDDGVDGTVNLNYNGNGTNWESGLQQAISYLNSADSDPTFVILVTDGACTASGANGTGHNGPINPAGNHQWTDFRPFYQEARNEALTIESRTDTTLFGIYAYGREADLLDDLIYYANNGSDRPGMDGQTVATENYFNASDTSALTEAIESIFQTIVNALGVTNVGIADGTTNEVETSTGEISELLEVIEEYQYWISIPLDSNNQFQRVNLTSGEMETYTVTDNGDGTSTVRWGSNSVTVNGSVSGGNLKYEWTGKNALYNYDPPQAKLENGSVNWNLSSVGTLLDGVTYSVTFDVYPSQTTLDIVADIKNDPYVDESNQGAWGELDSNIQQYIDKNGNLSTNTTATLTWDDTREGYDGGSVNYTNPDPVQTDAVKQLAVSKEWENEIDSQSAKSVTLGVLRDDDTEPVYSVSLNSDNGWKGSVFVSIGIMRTNADGEMEVLKGSEGHDFTFSEPDDLTYHWELDVPTVHPMMIDGTLTVLIKVDEKHTAPSGATVYTINGDQYYADESANSLTATNYRRSSLNIKKVVEGENVPEDATFPFTLKVTNSLAPDAPPAGDDGHDSDYWVWISVRDKDGNPVTEGVSGATAEDGANGWYYAPSGSTITVNMKDGHSVRLNNLPTDSTYEITEGDLPTGFIFKTAKIKVIDGEGTTDKFVGGRTSTGTIESTNTVYEVTYTNEYAVKDITVTKVWDDASNQDGKRPETLELTVNNLPEGTTAPTPEITKSTDGNTWTYTWTGLPKYDSTGAEITYTVSENTVPSDYTMTGSPANNNGTITNSYTPETTDVTVTKAWNDADNQDGIRPEELTLTLNGLPDGTTAPTPEITKNGNTWTYKWSGLPKNANGNEITYTVTEDTVPEGYEVSGSPANNNGTITNTHATATTTYQVVKSWDDADDQDGKRPETISVQLMMRYTKAVESAATTDLTEAEKEAAPAATTEEAAVEEKQEVPAETAEAAETSETETLQTEEAAESEAQEAAPAEAVEETQAEAAETETAPEAAAENTETAVVEETAPAAEEANEAPVLKAEAINETAEAAEAPALRAEATTETVEETVGDPITLPIDGSLEYTWKDLAANKDGSPITYFVKEVGEQDGKLGEYTVAYNVNSSGTSTTIVNSYTPETTAVTVKKVWDDADDQDGKRPGSITMTLSNGQSVSLTADKNWEATVEGLPKYKDGQEITYSWEEGSMPEGYKLLSKEVSGLITTFTNQYTPETTDLTVKKVWNDVNDKDKLRPASVTVHVLANGEEIETFELNEENKWTATLEDLPVCEGGKEIKYTVTEDTVKSYTTVISGNAKDGFTVTNSHTPPSPPTPPKPPVPNTAGK